MNRHRISGAITIAAIFGALVAIGCSRVVVEPYSADKYKDGLRFYRPQPYILVSEKEDDKGKVTGNNISVIYLPDPTQEYVLRSETWIGTVTMKPTLADGWNLVALESTVDPKFAETINALVGAAKLGVAPGAKVAPGKDVTAPRPGLYKLVLPKNSGDMPTIVGPITFPP